MGKLREKGLGMFVTHREKERRGRRQGEAIWKVFYNFYYE